MLSWNWILSNYIWDHHEYLLNKKDLSTSITTSHLKLVFLCVYLEVILRVCLDTVYLTENWKYGSKIIFKCMNSIMWPICNESFVEKKNLYIRSTESALALLKHTLKKMQTHVLFSTIQMHNNTLSTLSLVGNVGSLPCERVVLCIIGLRGKQIDVQVYFSWTRMCP